MTGRSIQNYNVLEAPRPAPSVPELFYEMTLEEALEVEVQILRVRKTLGWIARNRPLLLEQLMGSTEPGSREFSAICLVYEAFERRVKAVTKVRNNELQESTKRGIRRNQRRHFHAEVKPLSRSNPNALFRGPQAC